MKFIDGQWYVEDENGDYRPMSSGEILEEGLVIGCE